MVVHDRNSYKSGLRRLDRSCEPQPLPFQMPGLRKFYAGARAAGHRTPLHFHPMGGGLRVGHMPARLLVAGYAALLALAILATAAVASPGGWAPVSPPPTVPPLVRIAAPQPMPAGVVTPVTERKVAAPKPKPHLRPATSSSTSTTTTLPPPPPLPPPPAIPEGKGMWIWK